MAAPPAQRYRKNQFIVLPSSDSEACADIVDIIPGERGPKSDINIVRAKKIFIVT